MSNNQNQVSNTGVLSLMTSQGIHGKQSSDMILLLDADNRDMKYLMCSISYKATEQSIRTSLTTLSHCTTCPNEPQSPLHYLPLYTINNTHC